MELLGINANCTVQSHSFALKTLVSINKFSLDPDEEPPVPVLVLNPGQGF